MYGKREVYVSLSKDRSLIAALGYVFDVETVKIGGKICEWRSIGSYKTSISGFGNVRILEGTYPVEVTVVNFNGYGHRMNRRTYVQHITIKSGRSLIIGEQRISIK